MREIKFRAKVIGETNYTYSNGFIKHKDGTITVIVSTEEDHCCTSPIQEGTLQEYTGINDKNGVEIYEGDILEYSHPTYISKHWEVIFYSGGFFMAGLPNKIRIYNIGEKLDYVKVIGNIHENQPKVN